jgi:Zn-dependent peptidase ImmA (M78 family)
MLPEEKVARRFSEKRGLRPPVDVESLVKEFAVLEEDFLPLDYDAVFLDKSAKHPRPRVIVTVGQPATRRAFTLAHELGHIVIPWHNGMHFCRVDSETRLTNGIVREVESQANRFAAELLMPSAWVVGLIGSVRGLKNLMEAVKQANVSYHAASIRLIQLLPAGFVFAEVDSTNCLVRAASSSGTRIRLPDGGSQFNKAQLDCMAADSATFKSGSSNIYWWRFLDKITPPAITTSAETASELIKRIARETFHDDVVERKAIMRVNGIIGSANGTNLQKGGGDLFTLLKQRFLGRHEIAPLAAHKLFDEFLSKRVNEIEERQRTGN